MLKNYNKFDIYYNNKSFEQSFTIYFPLKTQEKPLIIFIPGSGWLGFFPFIYLITDWWNSTLAKNLAKNGFTVINLRYRGTFLKNIFTFSTDSIVFLVLLFILNFFLGAFIYAFIIFYTNITNSTPEYNFIIEDILNHFNYIDNNYDFLKNKYKFNSDTILVGYSSGAQILCEKLKKYGLLNYKKLFITNIVFISGVLNLYEKISESSRENKIANFCINLYNSWIYKEKLFSPISFIDELPQKPYTIISCINEFPNIPILNYIENQIFCAKTFYKKLKNNSLNNLIYIDANHWNILSNINLISVFNNL